MTKSNMYCSARPLIDTDYHRMGRKLVSPFDPAQVQPASYDVRLATRLLVAHADKVQTVDLREPLDTASMFDTFDMGPGGFKLWPGDVCLASTAETVSVPADMLCSVEGKSSLGRVWLSIHATAGFIDPGFTGKVTLEITNGSPWCIMLYPGMPIGQLRFFYLGVDVGKPYGSPGLGSHYQNAVSVEASAGFYNEKP